MASIRKQGKAWQAIIRKKGHRTLSKFFPKKALAQAWARKTEEELSKKLYINTRAQELSVAEIMNRYADEITPRKKSAEIEKYRIATVIKHLGDYILEDLAPAVVLEFVDERLQDVSSDSIRKELGVLSLAIDASMALWGVELPANPVHTTRNILKVTRTLKTGNKRERRPTNEELEILYECSPGIMPKIIAYAIETGMRRGEITNQQHGDRNGNILHIPETKTDIPRTIPLSPRACAILDNLPERSGSHIWQVTPSYISNAFSRTCKCAGDQRLTVSRSQA